MKKSLFLILLFASFSVYAQNDADTTKPWKTSGMFGVNLNQSSFTNWSAGGENSYAVTAIGKFFADYTKDNFSINNSLNLKYGLQKNESYDNARKSEDLIELISQFNQKFSKNWSAAAQLNFTSQFANGYNYPDDSTTVSKFLAPGYLNFAPGVLYKPVEYFSILISPATMRGIFVTDQGLADVGAYGVDKADTLPDGSIDKGTGKKAKIKVGAFVEFYFKKEVAKNVNVESRLNMFYNYLQDNNIPDGKMPLDFNWQTFLNLKINDWLSTNVFVHMVYMPGDVFIDREVLAGDKKPEPNDKMQILQTFGVGLAYNF